MGQGIVWHILWGFVAEAKEGPGACNFEAKQLPPSLMASRDIRAVRETFNGVSRQRARFWKNPKSNAISLEPET